MQQAEIIVSTFKEGLLASVAHDLQIRVKRCTLEEVAGQVTATIDATSLEVVSAMRDGRPVPSLLGVDARAEIERTLSSAAVLDARKYPQIIFRSTSVGPSEVMGQLTLHGVTREIRMRRREDTADVRLDQRDFGIKPYSAMLGTLRVKAEVVVRATLISPAAAT